MHPWAETFKSAARGLSDRERATLNSLPAPKPAFVQVRDDVVSSDREGMMQIFGEVPTFAGPPVTPESAMRLSSVYRATALLSGAVATMPLPVFRMSDDGETREPRATIRAVFAKRGADAPIHRSDILGVHHRSMLLRGDGFAVLIRNRAGEIQEIIPVPSECVTVQARWKSLIYIVYLYNDGFAAGPIKPIGLDQDDVLHFPGFGFNGLRSMSSSVGPPTRQSAPRSRWSSTPAT
jgi:phage portal protein BeeE